MNRSRGDYEWQANGNPSEDEDESSENGSHSTNSTTSRTNRNKGESDKEISGFDFLIPFINQLQTVFRTTGISSDIIQLPQIVVVGAQSSGKTSVLESLVQKSFLPRGDGIMTRCPIVLKLINTSGDKSQGEYCEFSHIKDKRFTNFLEVQQIITDFTNRIAGNGGGISKTGIQLTINSPNVVTLTVVDLPGLVKVAAAGQSDDIKLKIRELVLDYIKPKNSLILAVSAANNDLETSDSLEIAREVDPNGDRTLAVLTKLDLAADNIKLLKVLKGQVIPVKLGIIGVINRSDRDIAQNKSFNDTAEHEKKFLLLRYPSIASQHGSKFLAHRLNRLLLTHIEQCFPELDKKLKELGIVYKERLDEVGCPEDLDTESKRHKMIDIIAEFATAYKAQVDGRSRKIDLTVPCGGARIDHIFQVNLINGLKELSPLINVSDEQIITAIRNSRQIGSRLFIPEDAFQELVKIQIGKMRHPVMDCANRVYEEMINMVPQCLSVPAQRFPKINRHIQQILSEMLHRNFETSRHVLEQYMDIQSSSAITAQADFYEAMERSVHSLKVNGMGKLPLDLLLQDIVHDDLLKSCGKTERKLSSSVSADLNGFGFGHDDDLENGNGVDFHNLGEAQDDAQTNSSCTSGVLSKDQLDACKVVRDLMESFFDIVLRQVQDYVPKSLLFTLVYATVDDVHQELNKKLTIVEKVEDLMKESESIVTLREAISNDVQALEEACKQLEEVREKSVF